MTQNINVKAKMFKTDKKFLMEGCISFDLLFSHP